MRAAPRRLLAAILLTAACHREATTPPPAAPLTADGARQIADRLLARDPSPDYAYSFTAANEREHDFEVHYARQLACKPKASPPAPVTHEQPDGTTREFTATVDLCPINMTGTTILVRKSDGHASFVGIE